MNVDGMSDGEVRRLLAALWPTRFERFLDVVVRWLWRSNVLYDRRSCLGDRLDDLRCGLQRRRAAQGRHLVGRRS